MKGPQAVSWKMNVKASSGRVDPIQANRFGLRSIAGWKWSANLSRKRLLMPSATTTRSTPATSSSCVISVPSMSLTPSSTARSLKMRRRVRREQPQKPLPPIRCTEPLKWIAISSQYANARVILS